MDYLLPGTGQDEVHGLNRDFARLLLPLIRVFFRIQIVVDQEF